MCVIAGKHSESNFVSLGEENKRSTRARLRAE